MSFSDAVTIAVPIYIREYDVQALRWLEGCVKSCAGQVRAYPFRIELWDDGSENLRLTQKLRVLARRFHCDVFESDRNGRTTAGYVMNSILDHCETTYLQYVGCDDELHPEYVLACVQAWNTADPADLILGTATDCMKEFVRDGKIIRQKFEAASSPMYLTELAKTHRYDESLEHGIDGAYQKLFWKDGYSIRKVALPLYLYRFHEKQLSSAIHYENDQKYIESHPWVMR